MILCLTFLVLKPVKGAVCPEGKNFAALAAVVGKVIEQYPDRYKPGPMRDASHPRTRGGFQWYLEGGFVSR